MPPPVNSTFIQKSIIDLVIGIYFGMRNPLPTLICLPEIILERPGFYLKFAGVYGSVFGAITTLVSIGYTIKHATRIVKNIIKKKKQRSLNSEENKFINDVAKDTKKSKKPTKRSILSFITRRTKNQS